MIVLIYTVFAAVLSYLCVASDSKSARLTALAVDGDEAHGSSIVVASAWGNRRVGLLNQAMLAPRSGLLLRDCKSVHTRGMLFPIDVVFLDRDDRVLAIHEAVDVERVIKGPRGAKSVLELAAGAARSEFALRPAVGLAFRPAAWPKVRTEIRTTAVSG